MDNLIYRTDDFSLKKLGKGIKKLTKKVGSGVKDIFDKNDEKTPVLHSPDSLPNELLNMGIVPGDQDQNVTNQVLSEVANQEKTKDDLNKLLEGTEETGKSKDPILPEKIQDENKEIIMYVAIGIAVLLLISLK